LRTTPRHARATLPVLSLALVACIGRGHVPYQGPAETASAQATGATAPPPPWTEALLEEPSPVTVTPRRRVGRYRTLDLVLPSTGDNRQDGNLVRARYYRRERAGKRGVVFVVPIWGRSSQPPLLVARRILRYGELDVIRLLEDRPLFDWGEIRESPTPEDFRAEVQRSADAFAATAVDLGRLLDWALARPDVDPERVGIVGFSMSAMVASVAAGIDGRFTHGVFVLASTDLAWVFSECPHRTRRVREAVLERFGWTRTEFRRQITPILDPINPEDLAGGIHPSRVLFVQAARDACMPQPASDALWERLGRPELLTVDANHRNTFLALTLVDGFRLTRRIGGFLHRTGGPLPGASRVATAGTAD